MKSDEVEIMGYSPKGHGLVKLGNRRPVEVPRTLMGEKVVLEPSRRRQKRAGLKSVSQRSSVRIKPFCPHFGQCGGCSWQHMDLKKQRSLKQSRIEALFGMKSDPIIAPKESRRYRNKMEFSFTSGRFEDALGLMPFYGGPVAVAVKNCGIAPKWMGKALAAVNQWWKESGLRAFHFGRGEGALRTLTLREMRTGHKMAILTVSGDPRFACTKSELALFVEVLEKTTSDPLAIYVTIHQALKGHPTQLFTMHMAGPDGIEEHLPLPGDKSLKSVIGPHSFYQPNTAGAELIIKTVGEMLERANKDLLVDLYCGSGLLGMSQAHHFDQVVGIEIVREAVIDGKEAAKRSQIENIRFESGAVGDVLPKLDVAPSACIIDPPRAGCEGAIVDILALNAPDLVYVSCSPKTQSIDLKELLAAGYRVQRIQPIDQFSHTPHVENVIHLKRSAE